jgi:hypothetical protein
MRPPSRFVDLVSGIGSSKAGRGKASIAQAEGVQNIDNRPQLQRAHDTHMILRGGCGGMSSGPPEACIIVITISTDLGGGALLVLVSTVIRTCGLVLGNELIACSIFVLSRFRRYDTTVFLLIFPR